MPPTHHITLLRHAESEGNVKNLFMGQDDHRLTENGRCQAHALAQRWAHEGRMFDKIIASPLSRARETAEFIASELGPPIETEPLWMEQDFGEWNPLVIPDVIRDPNTPKYFTP
ncbi:MAG TPA: histidine phosphatase family protein, partial [Anaerolineales bacterium]|nr:histidine phosphatase family protein [Anaerolineales bacterium]